MGDELVDKVVIDYIASGMITRKQKLMTGDVKKIITKLYGQENDSNPIVYTRLFNPYGDGVWLVTEYDGEDILYGAVKLKDEWEMKQFSLGELEQQSAYIDGKSVENIQGIERDTNFVAIDLFIAKED